MQGEPIVILLVGDDPSHAEIVMRNFKDSRIANRVIHVSDGQEALDYLYRRDAYSQPDSSPRPGMVLLDLRLPKIDGLEVLKTVKEDSNLKNIPVVVLTTSNAETDIAKAYNNCANSYLVKPVDFQQFSKLLEAIGFYWLAWNQHPSI